MDDLIVQGETISVADMLRRLTEINKRNPATTIAVVMCWDDGKTAHLRAYQHGMCDEELADSAKLLHMYSVEDYSHVIGSTN